VGIKSKRPEELTRLGNPRLPQLRPPLIGSKFCNMSRLHRQDNAVRQSASQQ